jgi:hypothetical protein
LLLPGDDYVHRNPSTHNIISVALETLGHIYAQGSLTIVSGNLQETARLFQRLSICTIWFNAAAFRGTFVQLTGEEDCYLQNEKALQIVS